MFQFRLLAIYPPPIIPILIDRDKRGEVQTRNSFSAGEPGLLWDTRILLTLNIQKKTLDIWSVKISLILYLTVGKIQNP